MKHYKKIIVKKKNVKNHILYLTLLLFSFFSMLLAIFDFSRPRGGIRFYFCCLFHIYYFWLAAKVAGMKYRKT